MQECTDYDMYELETQDADERTKLSHAALAGVSASSPLESDLPDVDVQTGPLTFVVASDFVRRAVYISSFKGVRHSTYGHLRVLDTLYIVTSGCLTLYILSLQGV